jgi:hypothetical protein
MKKNIIFMAVVGAALITVAVLTRVWPVGLASFGPWVEIYLEIRQWRKRK